jgi:SNF2 family DNA or RNA helicase
MAILHGSWLIRSQSQSVVHPPSQAIDSLHHYFFIWGETWRRIEPIEIEGREALFNILPPPPHPFAMTAEELIALLRSLHQSRKLNWTLAEVPLGEQGSKGAAEAAEAAEAIRNKRRSRQSLEVETMVPGQSERWQAIAFSLPTYCLTHPETGTAAVLPQHSAAALEPLGNDTKLDSSPLELQPWEVQGIALSPLEAVQFLNSLPLSSVSEESFLGADLRFWSHVARWSLDLLARSKFLPGLDYQTEEQPEGQSQGHGVAYWQALIDSATDQVRLEQFARRMPAACQTYQAAIPSPPSPTASFPSPQTILLSFLHHAVDAQVRPTIVSQPLPLTQFSKDVPLREWLQALGMEGAIDTDSNKLERLKTVLSTWTAPLERQLSQPINLFRTCFNLKPPTSTTQTDWMLEYFLQAIDDPDFLVDAETIWSNPVDQLVYQGRTIEQPQETLLAGLGLASRLYPLIETSLQVQQPQFCSLNPVQVYEFIRETAWRLQDSGFGVVLPPSLANQQGWASRLGLSIRAETPARGKNQTLGLKSLLNFKWELTIGGQRLTKAEFDRLVVLNTPLVEINGEWVELRSQDIKAAQTFFQSRKDQMSLSLEDALRISTGDTQVIEKLPVLNFEASGALQDLIATLTTGNQSVESIPIPEAFQGELRPYQVRGASWLAFLQQWGLGACLADDMGLGKTIQFIALMLHLQEQGALENPTLLVCPTSVLGNWEREVKRFGPSLNVLVHHGDKRAQGKMFAKAVKDKHLIITSYALVYRDEKELKSISWEGLVLDEAQNIKNAESKQSQAVRQLEAEFRVALTGTPVENRLSELWSIMDFLNPGYLGPRNFFQRRFAVPIERYGDTDSLKTLRSLVQPFILRRLKTDRTIIQDLPEKQEMTVFCSLSAEQASLYQKIVEQSLVDIESAEGIQRKGMILALLTKLKQICNHPTLFKGEGRGMKDEGKEKEASSFLPHPSSFQTSSGKLQRLSEMLEEVLSEGDRSLIFTQFAGWGKLLKAYLEHHFNREVLFLYGDTPQKQREEMVDRFQNDPQAPRVFILSLKAGGVGLNLTRANHVFHFDRWWNPAVENQATDRVFRIGQTRNVQVHKFVCTGTLEERIHELIESKKALSEQVVGAGENWLTELDSDQLRNLLLLDRAAVIDETD